MEERCILLNDNDEVLGDISKKDCACLLLCILFVCIYDT